MEKSTRQEGERMTGDWGLVFLLITQHSLLSTLKAGMRSKGKTHKQI
ncbi:hypothetical protein [Nostoc sp.]